MCALSLRPSILTSTIASCSNYHRPLGLEKSWFKGLILVSGVFSLFCPLRKELLDLKNKGFVLAYVYPTFGLDETVRRSASPLVLLEPETTPSGTSSLIGTLSTEIAKKAGCDMGEKAAFAANKEVRKGINMYLRADKSPPPKLPRSPLLHRYAMG